MHKTIKKRIDSKNIFSTTPMQIERSKKNAYEKIIKNAYTYKSLSSVSIMPFCCSLLATNSAKRDIISEAFIFVQFRRHFWLINHQTSCLVCIIYQGNFRSRLDSICYDRFYLIHNCTSFQLEDSIRQKNHQYDTDFICYIVC